MSKTPLPKLSTTARILSEVSRLRTLRVGLVGALGILPLVLPFSVWAQKPQGKGQPGPAAAGPKEAIKTGRTLFVKNCSPCHGSSGQGGEGPNLQKMTLTDATIGTTIKKGVKGEMPAFGSKFKEGDVKALTAFVRSIEK
jgi:mono/diheme cytochrome c family protein